METDEHLAKRLQDGDKNALATLVTRHHAPLIGYLYRMCGGNRALAEDMTQEAFLRVIRAIDQYHYPRPFKAWLYTIATNLIRDHYKRAETRYATVDVDSATLAATHGRPERDIEQQDDAQQVIDALTVLSETHRAVVVLRYYQELPLNDIADILDIPTGTVKSRLANGLKKLRQALEKDYSHEP